MVAQSVIDEDDYNDDTAEDIGNVEWGHSAKFENEEPPGPTASTPSSVRTPRIDAPAVNPAARRLEPIAVRSSDQSSSTAWWPTLEPLARSPERARTADLGPPEPLLRRTWQRAILTEIGATFHADGEPDISALVEAVARQKLLKQIPRQRVKSNRLGLCCYVDVGDGMGPFAADQREFLRDLQKVIGKDALSLKRFRGTPLRSDWQGAINLGLPPHGHPILILSDLGIGRPRYSTDPAPISDWLKFINILAEAANPVIALVPYPPTRWPMELSRSMNLLFWDPTTNSRAVAATVRRRRASHR